MHEIYFSWYLPDRKYCLKDEMNHLILTFSTISVISQGVFPNQKLNSFASDEFPNNLTFYKIFKGNVFPYTF